MVPWLVGAILVLVAVTGALGVLWWRQRGRIARLEAELGAARAAPLAGGRATLKAVFETAALVREKGVGGAIRSSIEELAGWAQTEHPDLRRLAAADGTITIMFSDIEDSTALNEELGDQRWLRVLDGDDRVVHGEVERHEGHVVKAQGDGFMVAFAHPEGALRTAIGIQRRLESGRARRGTKVRVRIGIHVGPAVERDGDLFGRNVALAARVADRAHGGQILVTAPVREAVAPLDEFAFEGAGGVELKGLKGDHEIYAVELSE